MLRGRCNGSEDGWSQLLSKMNLKNFKRILNWWMHVRHVPNNGFHVNIQQQPFAINWKSSNKSEIWIRSFWWWHWMFCWNSRAQSVGDRTSFRWLKRTASRWTRIGLQWSWVQRVSLAVSSFLFALNCAGSDDSISIQRPLWWCAASVWVRYHLTEINPKRKELFS